MRCLVALLLGPALLVPAAGCRNGDLVEAELRTKEHELRELRAHLLEIESQNESLQHELHVLRPGSAAKIAPELASRTCAIREIVLGRLTGGYDEDGCPGDEALQVVLEPLDGDGHAIKAPGSLHIEVHQVSVEGMKLPLGAWDVPPEDLRRTWRDGFLWLCPGYYVVLPWKTWPSTPKLRVTAHFTLADERAFEADRDVTIRLTPPDKRPHGALAPIPETLGPAMPPGDSPLPLPRKVEPTDKFHPADAPAKGVVEPASLWESSATPPAVLLQRPVPMP